MQAPIDMQTEEKKKKIETAENVQERNAPEAIGIHTHSHSKEKKMV